MFDPVVPSPFPDGRADGFQAERRSWSEVRTVGSNPTLSASVLKAVRSPGELAGN